jgi:hypothetical protein
VQLVAALVQRVVAANPPTIRVGVSAPSASVA